MHLREHGLQHGPAIVSSQQLPCVKTAASRNEIAAYTGQAWLARTDEQHECTQTRDFASFRTVKFSFISDVLKPEQCQLIEKK